MPKEDEAAAAPAKAATEQAAADKATADAAAAAQKVQDDAAALAAAEQAKQKQQVVEYNLTLEKGSTLDAATLEKTVAIARELGLSNDAAQKMLKHFDGVVAGQLTAKQAEFAPGGRFWTEQVATWEKAALADPDLGGTPALLAANVKEAKRVFDTFFDPEVHEFLNVTGFGSHPQFLKGFVKMSKAFAEGTLRKVGGAPEPGRRDIPIEDRFYPKKESSTK